MRTLHLWTCPTCFEQYGLAIAFQDWLWNPRHCRMQLDLMEIQQYQHRIRCVYELINKGGRYELSQAIRRVE